MGDCFWLLLAQDLNDFLLLFFFWDSHWLERLHLALCNFHNLLLGLGRLDILNFALTLHVSHYFLLLFYWLAHKPLLPAHHFP